MLHLYWYIFFHLFICIYVPVFVSVRASELKQHGSLGTPIRLLATGPLTRPDQSLLTAGAFPHITNTHRVSQSRAICWNWGWHCQNCQTVYQHQPQCFSGCSGPFWYFHNFPIYPQKWFKLSISLLSMSSNPRPMLWKHQSGGSLSCLKRIRWHYQICLTCANTCHPSPAELAYPTLNYMRGCGKKIFAGFSRSMILY